MEIIGIICEYNPFHNGHAYHIQKIKEMYPDSLIILVLNGYFLERGEVSILNKEDKVKIALENNVNIVIEHPFIFGSSSADIFADSAIKLLNHMGVKKFIFGSESNNLNLLKKIAQKQFAENFNDEVKANLKDGNNYPTALNKAIGISLDSPNDLLGVSYIKAILLNNFDIEPITIQRTNNYHDKLSNDIIVSASNIREKIKQELDISKYTKYNSLIKTINEQLLFNLLKYKIISDQNLKDYLSVDEGIEFKLKKEINNALDLNDFILKIKTRRYTYNRIRRMLIHILIGLTKKDKIITEIEYIKLLGFNDKGKVYINKIKKDITIPLSRKISENYVAQKYELLASLIYDMLSGDNTHKFETSNKPIYIQKSN